jgi:hypothetical protein
LLVFYRDMLKAKNVLVFYWCLMFFQVFAQPAPGSDMNIPFLVTFGKNSETKWGDHDFVQTFFVEVPVNISQPFYIRIYDPDVYGKFDEPKGPFDTHTRFSVYGGKGTVTGSNATKDLPVGSRQISTLLKTKVFGQDPKMDGQWFAFGPFNPTEGELNTQEYNGYIFKILAEGLDGDDGNLYRYFVSSSPNDNVALEGANIFTYEYTFRLYDEIGSVSHIYPFVTEDVVAVHIKTFDLDDDSYMRLVSVAKRGEPILGSKEDQWAKSIHEIVAQEKKTSLDIQIVKSKSKTNNNMVMSITNQYGKNIPFYNIPIGGVPKYKYTIKVK